MSLLHSLLPVFYSLFIHFFPLASTYSLFYSLFPTSFHLIINCHIFVMVAWGSRRRRLNLFEPQADIAIS